MINDEIKEVRHGNIDPGTKMRKRKERKVKPREEKNHVETWEQGSRQPKTFEFGDRGTMRRCGGRCRLVSPSERQKISGVRARLQQRRKQITGAVTAWQT